MSSPRLAMKLLVYCESVGAREELVGDLLEAAEGGRTPMWIWRQLLGLYAAELVTQARRRARLNPPIVAFALCVVLFAAISSASFSRVLEVWLTVYYVTGTLSLVADLSSRIATVRPRFTDAT